MISCLLLFLSGCTNIKEIQFQAYAVGIGIEYKADEYHVILQFLDFSNVAKTEQGKSIGTTPVWLASGKGKTVEDAISKVLQGVQIPVNLDQLSLFIFGRSVLENRLEKTLEALDTNFNIRLTGWVYGTEEAIGKIFTMKVPFNYDFSNSRIIQPQYLQHQESSVPAITLQELIFQHNEKTKTVILPNISMKETIIKKDRKKEPTAIINGAYIIHGKKMNGFLSENDLKGYIRVNKKSFRSSIMVSGQYAGKKEYVQIELLKPKIKKTIEKNSNGVKIGLNIKVSATVRESSYFLSPKLKNQIKEKIKSEVYSAYQKSHEISGDIYQFEDYLYRFRHNEWKKLHNSGKIPILNKNDIRIKIVPLKSINKINSGIRHLIE